MVKVLITGAGAVLGQEIFQSLKYTKLLPDLFIGFADPSPHAVGLHWSDTSHLIPMASDDEYIDVLVNILKDNCYQVLIPGTDVELPKISRFREHIESTSGCKVIVSLSGVIDIANDKFLTSVFMDENGFCPPRSWSNETLLLDDINNIPYPLIVKPRDGARSKGVVRVECPSELSQALSVTEFPVIQECIGSIDDEFTAGTITFAGKCYGSILLRRTLRDGNTWTAQVVNDERLQHCIACIAEALNPAGPCNFQFRLDQSGNPRVFEINARFSGTTYMRTLAGFDEVSLCILYALNGIKPNKTYTVFEELFFMRSFALTSISGSFMA